MPQWDPSDSRDEMEVDDAPVGVPCARPQRKLLRGQPALSQIHCDGEAGAFVATAPAMSISEIGCQRLSCRLVGAGGIPPPTIAPCERIDALLDHRVVAVSLACHVTLHDVLLQATGDVPAGRRHRQKRHIAAGDALRLWGHVPDWSRRSGLWVVAVSAVCRRASSRETRTRNSGSCSEELWPRFRGAMHCGQVGRDPLKEFD